MNYAFYDRIKSGENPETIAQEITKELNAAIQKHEDEKLAAASEHARLNDAKAVTDAIKSFCDTYYPETAEFLNFTPEEFCNLCATYKDLEKDLNAITNLFGDLFK